MYIMGYTLYMELTLWMQWYGLILEDFGFKKEDDGDHEEDECHLFGIGAVFKLLS